MIMIILGGIAFAICAAIGYPIYRSVQWLNRTSEHLYQFTAFTFKTGIAAFFLGFWAWLLLIGTLANASKGAGGLTAMNILSALRPSGDESMVWYVFLMSFGPVCVFVYHALIKAQSGNPAFAAQATGIFVLTSIAGGFVVVVAVLVLFFFRDAFLRKEIEQNRMKAAQAAAAANAAIEREILHKKQYGNW